MVLQARNNIDDDNNENKNDNYMVCGTCVGSDLKEGRKC